MRSYLYAIVGTAVSKYKWPLAKVKQWPWPRYSCTHLTDHYMYKFKFIEINSFYKIYSFNIFTHKSIWKQIWSCTKEDHYQTRIIICIYFVGPESPMLYTKFQDHRYFGSGEEDFKGFLRYMGVASWSCDLNHLYTACTRMFPWAKKSTHERTCCNLAGFVPTMDLDETSVEVS